MNQATANAIYEQYQALKTEYPNSLLLIRVSGYFEAFGDDARKLAETCRLRLNQRNKIDLINAGFPCETAQKFIEQLIKSGIIVAVAERVKSNDRPPQEEVKTIVQRRELVPEKDGDVLWA